MRLNYIPILSAQYSAVADTTSSTITATAISFTMPARKNVSPTISAIHPDTYTQLASANAGECWLCGLNGKHATQVVSTPDLPLVRPPATLTHYHKLTSRSSSTSCSAAV